MNNPLVTVVVPIYNVEKYLNRCLDSIVNQTYQNLEIILVDDGSLDNCPRICDEYAQKDNRIKVIHKQNAGQGIARNVGIANATGKYICFFDSDDYIDANMIEECCFFAERERADLVCCGHQEETFDGIIIRERIPAPPKNIFEGEEIKRRLMPMTLSYDAKSGEDWNLSLSACFGLFSLTCIRDNKWKFASEREVYSEDIYSVLDFYRYVNKVVFVNMPFYHYVYNSNSTSRSYRTDRYDKIKVFSD